MSEASEALQQEIERAIVANGLGDDILGHLLRTIGSAARVISADVDRVERATEEAATRRAVLSPDGEKQLAERLSHAVRITLSTWQKRIDRRLAVAVGAAGLILLLLGFGAGWFAHGSGIARECALHGEIRQAEKGGKFCVLWLANQ